MNKKEFVIAPSLLAADFTRLGEQIAEVEAAGAEWIHCDIMDGHFVPNITMGPFIVYACHRATKLPLDVHLMIEKPEQLLKAYAEAGAALLNVHVETCPHLHNTLQQIKSLNCKAGVTINPGTPASFIKPVLHLVDLVLVMCVNPGFGGQEFLPETIAKVAEVRQMLDEINSPAWIEVDGGITDETILSMWNAGATAFVAGSFIFRNPNGSAAGIEALRRAIIKG
ncbi:MAG: ribulose-phosphate 3-epimerase [Anaerolineales bacterium]|nr:ribulose-phosphate 3-epimerase [Anaerolineales bacterium]